MSPDFYNQKVHVLTRHIKMSVIFLFLKTSEWGRKNEGKTRVFRKKTSKKFKY
jgi:hypothetical protein